MRYDHKWHIGQVLEIDFECAEIEVNFLRPSKSIADDIKQTLYKWPQPPDELTVSKQDVICKIKQPEAVGRSRSFRLSADDLDKIECRFNFM